jgi:hypothetical protein
MEVAVYTLQGNLVYRKADLFPGEVIDITHQPEGSYILRVTCGKEVNGKMIQKL